MRVLQFSQQNACKIISKWNGIKCSNIEHSMILVSIVTPNNQNFIMTKQFEIVMQI